MAAAVVLAAPAAAAPPTDPMAGGQQPLSILKVPQALDRLGAPLADIPVLVADTGQDLQHPDLAPRLFSLPAPVAAPDPDGNNPDTVPAGAAGWDLIGGNNPPNLNPDSDPDDPLGGSGHGSIVAGVLGAAWNNGAGGAGVAPNARFVVLRTCWDGDQCYQYVQASAFNWAADRGARVVSMSWLSGPLEAGLQDAIVSHPNVLFVAIPSGNGGAYDADGDNPMPCALDSPNVLCVTTSGPDDGLDCGAYGPTSVDVAVPTRNNVTTANGGGFSSTGCATSYASPAAAGVATILFGMDPSASAADVRSAIVDSARRVPAFEGRSVSGGIVDADAAVALFQSRRGLPVAGPPPGPPPPPPPPAAPDTVAPTLRFSVSPRQFRPGRRGVRLSRTARSIVFRNVVSEAATLTISVERARRLRSGRLRWTRVGRIVRTVPAGASRVVFSGRGRGGRALPVASYRARARAADAAGNRSPLRSARFRIVPR